VLGSKGEIEMLEADCTLTVATCVSRVHGSRERTGRGGREHDIEGRTTQGGTTQGGGTTQREGARHKRCAAAEGETHHGMWVRWRTRNGCGEDGIETQVPAPAYLSIDLSLSTHATCLST
jgi:hypothetical protein